MLIASTAIKAEMSENAFVIQITQQLIKIDVKVEWATYTLTLICFIMLFHVLPEYWPRLKERSTHFTLMNFFLSMNVHMTRPICTRFKCLVTNRAWENVNNNWCKLIQALTKLSRSQIQWLTDIRPFVCVTSNMYLKIWSGDALLWTQVACESLLTTHFDEF